MIAWAFIIAGLALMGKEITMDRPWQAGVALGFLMIFCGGAWLCDATERRLEREWKRDRR